MRIANIPLFVTTICTLFVTAASAQVPDTLFSPVMPEQNQPLWEVAPYPSHPEMMPYYYPDNAGFNTGMFPTFPMLQNRPMWGDMQAYPMGSARAPYYMVYPAEVEQTNSNTATVAPSVVKTAPPTANEFAPLEDLPSASKGVLNPSKPLYSAPYYLPMLVPDSFKSPLAPVSNQFFNNESDDYQALAESAQLISKLKQTISDSITVLTKTSNDRDKLLKRITALEETIQRSKAHFGQLTGSNDALVSTKNQLLGKAKSTLEGNITTMQHFLTFTQKQNNRFAALQQQFQQQQHHYGTTATTNEALINNKNQLLGKAKETLNDNIVTMQRSRGEYDQLTVSLADLKSQISAKTQDNSALQYKVQAFAGLSQQLSSATADDDKDGVVNPSDKCPNTPRGTYVDADGCLADIDHDGIADNKDKCAFTSATTVVNETGCEQDSDKDGVIDSKDQCPASEQGVKILPTGCEEDTDKDDVANSKDQCPNTGVGNSVDANGCALDTDKDAIIDSKDQCPNTAQGIKVNAQGCEIDTDKDGLVDSQDRCPNTLQGIKINDTGCEMDTDKDGLVDSQDRCPNTLQGIKINDKGCEMDTDKDGIADSKDQCPATDKRISVDSKGCGLDGDKDDVADHEDQCPATAQGIKVNQQGCEIDSDKDSIVDSKDQCPATAKGIKIDAKGCEVDTDADEIVDSEDQCPHSSQNATVDAKGCELDADKDGIVDSNDDCKATASALKVDSKGCELDADSDGVADSKDQCAKTATDAQVDATGCALDRDHDGVLDHLDQCTDTPKEAVIDKTTGCAPDADKDGISDNNDLCPSTTAGVTPNSVGCAANENITLKGVNFKIGSAELTSASLPLLNDAAKALKRHPDIHIEVGGHTDSVGGAVTNKALSQKRATSVMNYLISNGINSRKITAKGYGEETPIANNKTAEGRASNRRVELKMTH